MFDIISFAGGSVIGVGIAWILECWVGLFLKQLTTEHSKGIAQPTSANNSKIFEQPRTKLRITVNTGLFGKSNKISKSLYEKDLSSGLNDYILKQFFTDPGVPLFLTLYIIIIKNSKNLIY